MVNANPKQLRESLQATPLEDLTDEQLVTAHLDGRPGAFQRLYDRYRDRLIHFITRKTGDADRAQDLVQEAFIRVTRHLHRFDTSKKFSTWVYTIASNLAKNELRNRSRNPLILFGIGPLFTFTIGYRFWASSAGPKAACVRSPMTMRRARS